MKITVVGCGRWGSLIAWYLADARGLDVTLYGREDSEHIQRFIKERRNDLLTLPDSVAVTTSLDCLKGSDVIIISINSQGLAAFMDKIRPLELKDKIFVLCMKGIDIESGMRLSTVAETRTDGTNKIAVWIGPGHVQEFYAGIPNCMVIDCNDNEVKKLLVDSFSSDLIRFYYGEDMIGNEIGAAAKNVIGIAAGMLDGYGLSSLKGALMSRGCREVARLIAAMGGNELSAYGLCHLGDYEATVFSKYSHNREFGERFVRGERLDKLAEGYYTAKALKELSEEHGVDMPICHAVYEIIYEGKDAQAVFKGLFQRSITTEFYK
jgi:glycerol-3-phosphate dehydrogenase (NAD(P)+)